MILDHPKNLNTPTVARIHPTRLPFFCYVPGHDVMVTISADSPTVFRYRVMIHDGRPDAALDERLWRDFAEPPRVTVAAGGRLRRGESAGPLPLRTERLAQPSQQGVGPRFPSDASGRPRGTETI